MTIAFGSSSNGGAANGQTSVAVPYPAVIVGGDMLLLFVENKYPTNAPTTPTGWTLGLRTSGGSGSAGIDSGTVYMSVFWKLADASESGTETVTVTSGDSTRGFMIRYTKDINKPWVTPAFVGGSSDTAGVSWSATMSADPGITANDFVVVASAVNGNAATFSSQALTTTGITYGSMSERSDGSTALGDDSALVVADFPASSGTSSAAPVYTMTGSATSGDTPAGCSVLIRLREDAARDSTSWGANGSTAAGTTSVNVPYPSGISAGHLLLMGIAGKYPPNTPSTPSGWALVSSASTSAGSAGVDDGPCWVYVFSKTADGSETGNETVTVTSGNTCCGVMGRYVMANASATLNVAACIAITDSENTSHAWTFDADPGLAVDDFLVLFAGANSDVGIALVNPYATTGTAKFDGPEANGSATSSNGDDCRLTRYHAYVRSGSTSGAPVINATTTTALSMAAVLVRIREDVTGGIPYAGDAVFRGVSTGVHPR